MREVLVIRFGALGDLCVLGWSLARLADRQAGPSCRVTLVTKRAFAPLMREMRGIDEVVELPENSLAGVRRLASRLRRRPWDTILDAHNTLRSHLLLGLMGRRPAGRLAKDTMARLGLMSLGRGNQKLDQRMVDRFNALTDPLGGPGTDPPATPPLIHLRGDADPAPVPVLGLAPGAQWDSKRWPVTSYTELMRRFLARHPGQVRIYLGPREASWFPGSELAVAAAADPAVEIVRLPALTEVARSLSAVTILVTNDSGLLHLAEAAGTPVLALFGPTVREFGYFPLGRGSRVLERDESCRPCSRNGKRPCHRQDLACLSGITPTQALTALADMLPGEES